MAEWLFEEGIGENRALLLDRGEVLAAKVRWPDELHAGMIAEAKLIHKLAGSQRGTAVDVLGNEILIDNLPVEVTEGSTIKVGITRAPMAERGRLKRAQGGFMGRGFTAPPSPTIFVEGNCVRRLPSGLWEEVWSSASSGEVSFAGGSLLFDVTPAMTVVDIDGDLPPRELALAAVPALARALRLFDVGGSIGIDFPTLDAKVDRKTVDGALETALHGWPHERTAMNGFGFVQIVARLSGPSLLHRFATSRTGMAARMALRQGELVEGPGTTLLTVHPAVKNKLSTEWLAELERRTARPVRVEADPALAIEAPHAQLVPR